ncbi:MAG: radical SAM protein, partial [Pseudobdellovibrionaceae bacterium]
MELRRWNDILAIKTNEGKFVGYHSRNLEVAELSEEIWKASAIDVSAAQDAIVGLNEWNSQPLTSQAEKRSKGFDSFTVNVTQICNLHCAYCAAGGDGSYGDPVKRISVEKTLPQLASFMEKLPAGETFRINFVGGEPLLYPEGIKLLAEYVREKGQQLGLATKFKLVTNGTQFNPTTIELLKIVQPYIIVSLDGPAEINDIRRPSKGGTGVTEKIMDGLRLLQPHKASFDGLEISGVFGPGNLDLMAAWNFYSQ